MPVSQVIKSNQVSPVPSRVESSRAGYGKLEPWPDWPGQARAGQAVRPRLT